MEEWQAEGRVLASEQAPGSPRILDVAEIPESGNHYRWGSAKVGLGGLSRSVEVPRLQEDRDAVRRGRRRVVGESGGELGDREVLRRVVGGHDAQRHCERDDVLAGYLHG